MRAGLRKLGALMILAGLGLLGWAALVWQWEDPFTSLYNRYEQRKLAQSYEERVASFAFEPVPPTTASRPQPTTTPAQRGARLASTATRYRRSLDPSDAIGRLRIPKLHVSTMFVEGTDSDTLRKGPGRYRGSFLPGEGHLIYVAGHRTTYGAPFSRLDRLVPGDRVLVEVPYGTFEYRVTRHIVVPADQLSVLKSRGREEIALQACHPRFFASHRLIFYAKPIRLTQPDGSSFRLPAEATASG